MSQGEEGAPDAARGTEATDSNRPAGEAVAAGDDSRPADADHPVRRGSVDLQLRGGERVHHDEAFVRYEPDAFVVATDPSFPHDSTVRYEKQSIAWVTVRHPRR